MNFVIGIDFGGTNIKSALLNKKGKILYRSNEPTDKDKTPDSIIKQLVSIAQNIIEINKIKKKDIVGIGLGSPGPLNPKTGIVECAPNLTNWRNVPLRQILKNKLKMNIGIFNDANAAAFAEFWLGSGKKSSSFILITLGTGIGGGIILNKKLYEGIDGTVGEIGHMTILPNGPQCGCGNFGCIESLASATALIKKVNEKIKEGTPTMLKNISPEILSTKDIYEAAKKGDKLSLELFEQTGFYLGILCSNLINLLNPEIIAFGGGLGQAGDFLFKPIIAEAKKRSLRNPFNRVKIIPASLGNDAGFIGAAGLIYEQRLK